MTSVLGEILGPDLVIILAIVLLLFGSSKIPLMARSLGAAKREYEEAMRSEAPAAGAVAQPGASSEHRPELP